MAFLARLLYLLCDSGVRVQLFTAQAPSSAGSPAYAGCFLNAAWKRFTASMTSASFRSLSARRVQLMGTVNFHVNMFFHEHVRKNTSLKAVMRRRPVLYSTTFGRQEVIKFPSPRLSWHCERADRSVSFLAASPLGPWDVLAGAEGGGAHEALPGGPEAWPRNPLVGGGKNWSLTPPARRQVSETMVVPLGLLIKHCYAVQNISKHTLPASNLSDTLSRHHDAQDAAGCGAWRRRPRTSRPGTSPRP